MRVHLTAWATGVDRDHRLSQGSEEDRSDGADAHPSRAPRHSRTAGHQVRGVCRGDYLRDHAELQLLEHPMRSVKRLRVENCRTRILTQAEQTALLAGCPKKLGRLVRLAFSPAPESANCWP